MWLVEVSYKIVESFLYFFSFIVSGFLVCVWGLWVVLGGLLDLWDLGIERVWFVLWSCMVCVWSLFGVLSREVRFWVYVIGIEFLGNYLFIR